MSLAHVMSDPEAIVNRLVEGLSEFPHAERKSKLAFTEEPPLGSSPSTTRRNEKILKSERHNPKFPFWCQEQYQSAQYACRAKEDGERARGLSIFIEWRFDK
jgi:hypothetical protein